MNYESADRVRENESSEEGRAWKLAGGSLNYRKRKETATTRIMIRRFIKSRSMDNQADISHRARGTAPRTHQLLRLHRFPDLPAVTTQSSPVRHCFPRAAHKFLYRRVWRFVRRPRTRSNTGTKTVSHGDQRISRGYTITRTITIVQVTGV